MLFTVVFVCSAALPLLLLYGQLRIRDIQSCAGGDGDVTFSRFSGDLPSPVPYTTSKKLVNMVATLAVPKISEAANSMTFDLPDMDDIETETMHLEDFSIKSIKVELATPSDDNITVRIVDLKLTVPDTKFIFTYGILTCPGTFRLVLNETQFTFNVHPYVVNDTLQAAISREATNITWGSMRFEHDLDSVFCRIGQSIVQIFIGKLDERVEQNIKEELPKKLPETLETEANKALKSSGVAFTKPLSMTPQRATGQIELIPRSSDDTESKVCVQSPSAVWSTTRDAAEVPNKDIGVVLASSSVNNFFIFAQQTQMLNATFLFPENITTDDIAVIFPEATALCANCRIGLGLSATTPPVISFEGADSLVRLALSDVITGLFLFPQTAEDTVELMRRLKERRGGLEMSPGAFPQFINELPLRQARRGRRVVTADGEMVWEWVTEGEPAVPVVALSVGVTLVVDQLGTTGDRNELIQYHLRPIEDLRATLVASNMGPFDLDGLTQNVSQAINTFVVPLLNADSPAKVPTSLVKDILISVDDQAVTGGFNISLF